MNSFLQNFDYCTTQSVPGVAQVWFKSRRDLGEFWYYDETHSKQYGKIIGNSDATGPWYTIISRRDSINFSQTQSNDVMRLYNMTFDMARNTITYYDRDLIEQMVVTEDLVIIFRDRNGRYRVIGETDGCKCLTWNFGTGNKQGQNETSLQFTCSERYPIREIDSTFVNGIIPPYLAICDLDWSEYCALGWTAICNDYQRQS